MRVRWSRLALLGPLAVGVAVLRAPAPTPSGATATIEGLVAELRDTGMQGGELVDAAARAVNRAFPYHSVWHMWEPPETAMRNGRGWSHQYNTVLRDVLEELGFEARLVHAARVQGWRHPWYFASHTWVKVNVNRRWLDACASRAANRAGDVAFTPVTDVLPFRRSTRWTVALGLAPIVVGGVWRSWLTRRSVPSWVYGRRD